MQYRYGPLLLETDTRLAGMQESGGEGTPCVFTLRRDSFALDADSWFQHRTEDNGKVWLSLGRKSGDYLLHFPHGLTFRVAMDARRVDCFAPPQSTPHQICQLLTNTVLPYALSLVGFLTLHASAVATPLGTVAFMGKSGAGKSTLAGALLSRGFPLVADDGLILEERQGRLRAIPAFPRLHLWRDSWHMIQEGGCPFPDAPDLPQGPDKLSLAVEPDGEMKFKDQPAPFHRLYLLQPGSERDTQVEFEPVPPRDAFLAVLASSYPLDVVSPDLMSDAFRSIAAVVSKGLWSANVPRKHGSLPAVVDQVLRHLRE